MYCTRNPVPPCQSILSLHKLAAFSPQTNITNNYLITHGDVLSLAVISVSGVRSFPCGTSKEATGLATVH